MRIKRLELCGFKSFVDKTIVNFEHQVMGIVGPNGCGKSNIVDAIRWSMGEQSAKHLRGRSMEDVIFNGSESRPAADMAEVTLTFENDDPTDVPLEYKDYAEIAVTRRLYRTGDSEYLINKTPVRLKDITDLFLGTGVGTKAYSIVEQGKIGLIVSAKPEDRRMLIEEAAGITKFKSRKRQAEKKMELTQQNLLRVGDIVAEIERNLGSLKRQAAKAERYLSYRNELEDLQLWEASHRFLELTGWVKLESGEVQRLGEEADGRRSALVAGEADLETLRNEAHGAESLLEEASNQNFAAENAVRAEEVALDRAKDKLATLAKREAQAEGEIAEIRAHQGTLRHELDGVMTEVTALSSEEADGASVLSAEDEKLSGLVREAEAADAHVAGARGSIAQAQADIASAEAKLEGFERRRAEMETRRERLASERDELETQRMEHEARAAQHALGLDDLRSGRVSSAEERQRLEEELGRLKEDIVGSDRALDDAKHDLSRARSRLHALQEVEARLDGVGAGTKQLVATKDPCIAGLVADRVEAPTDLVPALAGLLGARLQDVVVRDERRALELLADLASGKKGRATVMPLSPRHVAGASGPLPSLPGVVARLADALRYDPADEAMVRALVGDAVVVEDVEVGLSLRAAIPATLVTRDGTVLYPDGRIAGGTGEELAQGWLETKREIRALAEEVVKKDAHASECLARHQHLRQSIAEAQGGLERARQKAHDDELALVHAEKDLRAAEAQLEAAKKRMETVAAELADLEGALETASGERELAARVLEEARATLASKTEELAAAEAQAASWRGQVESQREVVMEKRVRVAGVRERLTGARGTVTRLEKSHDELDARANRLDEELRQGAAEAGETAAQLVKHKENLGLALDAARQAEGRLAEARTVFDAFRVSLSEKEALLKDLRAQSESARDELATHEMALREKELALSHLLQSVAEKFRGLELPRIIGDYHLRPPPDDESRARIGELSNLIDRMGSVNLDAMREHEEAEKRYAFYTEQKADLDRALADLERAIQQMNRESKRLFQDTFEAVNARFQEIFPKMFRGGRAALRLTNPEDMLETGIDILAQPPGKKLSSIELMSGGEKALTAVSLIFAIFQIKPSPFCILDEVDAPLDEANVARYNEMIRAMTDRSQFILITHIKRTMQMVDVLHGVTMQELGVSRLVSVRVADNAVASDAGPKKAEKDKTGGGGEAAVA